MDSAKKQTFVVKNPKKIKLENFPQLKVQDNVERYFAFHQYKKDVQAALLAQNSAEYLLEDVENVLQKKGQKFDADWSKTICGVLKCRMDDSVRKQVENCELVHTLWKELNHYFTVPNPVHWDKIDTQLRTMQLHQFDSPRAALEKMVELNEMLHYVGEQYDFKIILQFFLVKLPAADQLVSFELSSGKIKNYGQIFSLLNRVKLPTIQNHQNSTQNDMAMYGEERKFHQRRDENEKYHFERKLKNESEENRHQSRVQFENERPFKRKFQNGE